MDISFTVYLFVGVFVRLRISLPMTKLAASNFARWFMGFWAGNFPFWGTLLPQKPKVGPIGA